MLPLLVLSVCYLESQPVGNDSKRHKENARETVAAMATQHKVQTGKTYVQWLITWLALNRSSPAKHAHRGRVKKHTTLTIRAPH